MSRKTVALSDQLHQYLLSVSVRESQVLARLRQETEGHRLAEMQISPEQGQLMSLLVRLVEARNAIEVGVFTGYSSICIAGALAPGGRLVACDVSEEYTTIARRYWCEAGLQDRIDLRLAPAIETLDALVADGGTGCFDFAFIDADKTNYEEYFERCLTLVRPRGLIAIDNTLWDGAVIDPNNRSEDTQAIREFNSRRRDDPSVDLSLVPIGDGLTLALKR